MLPRPGRFSPGPAYVVGGVPRLPTAGREPVRNHQALPRKGAKQSGPCVLADGRHGPAHVPPPRLLVHADRRLRLQTGLRAVHFRVLLQPRQGEFVPGLHEGDPIPFVGGDHLPQCAVQLQVLRAGRGHQVRAAPASPERGGAGSRGARPLGAVSRRVRAVHAVPVPRYQDGGPRRVRALRQLPHQ